MKLQTITDSRFAGYGRKAGPAPGTHLGLTGRNISVESLIK